MKKRINIPPASVLLTGLATQAGLITGCDQVRQPEKPNIIFILADDLGYGELGVYGQQKIETKNIDRLASAGILFTDCYSGSPVSAPSRCVLLTGMHTGRAPIRGNDEWNERGDVWNFAKAVEDPDLEGQRPMPEGTLTIGSLLQNAGYKTAIIGKWGLGAPMTEAIPTKKGFDFFYGYNCQRQAHTFYPLHLWKNEEKVWLGNELVVPGTRLSQGEDPLDEKSYARYNQKQYSAELMHEEAKKFISENKDNPFFLYYATPIPHVPLQAPKEWVDYYVRKFGDEEPYDGSRGYFPARYPRATYAAMISYLDQQVGELIDLLKEEGLYENTIIFFTSDNGPTYAGGSDSPWFNSGGIFDSEYGKGKGFLQEGGIRVPMIAAWPSRIKPGIRTGHITAFQDVLPTLCEIAGAAMPEEVDGISFLPVLSGKEQQDKHEYLYWEFPESGGQIAIRMGNWKGIARDIKARKEVRFELYNLENDIKEENDLANDYPEIIKMFHEITLTEHTQPQIMKFRMAELGDSIR